MTSAHAMVRSVAQPAFTTKFSSKLVDAMRQEVLPSDPEDDSDDEEDENPAAAAAALGRGEARKLVYSVTGIGPATVREPERFEITARDEDGNEVTTLGEKFLIAIRGVARVRHRIVKGERRHVLTVEWKPPVSGNYKIAISKGGIAFPGSPFSANASTPEPHAKMCSVRGDGLGVAIALGVIRHATLAHGLLDVAVNP